MQNDEIDLAGHFYTNTCETVALTSSDVESTMKAICRTKFASLQMKTVMKRENGKKRIILDLIILHIR